MHKTLLATTIIAMFAGTVCFAADEGTTAAVAPATNGTAPAADSSMAAPAASKPASTPGKTPTMEERLDKAMAGFDTMDTDHDGAVSKTEFRAALEKVMTMHEAAHSASAMSTSTTTMPDAAPASGSGVSAGQ